MRVLIGCETSGVMRRAFAARGHCADEPPDATETRCRGAQGMVSRASPGPDRWKFRSRTFQGIADACADQWGGHATDAAVMESGK